MIRAILLTLLSITALALTDVERAELIAKNLMTNPGGERVTQGWANVGGTFTHTTTAAQVASGNAALNFDADASGDALDYTPVAIPQGAYKNVGVARCYFKGASAITHKFQVHDGTNILAEDDVTSSTDKFTATSLYFSFPNSGSVGLSIVAQADEAATYIDDCYIGLASGAGLSEVSQAEYLGSLNYAATASCDWSTTSASMATLGADTDCAAPTTSGSLEAPGTKIPAAVLNNLGPGKYKVSFQFTNKISSASSRCAWSIYDGSTYGMDAGLQHGSTGGPEQHTTLESVFEYTTGQSSKTWELHGQRLSGSGTCFVLGSNSDLEVQVYRYPTSSQTAFNFDSVNWKVDATIAGSDINLGTSAVASLSEIIDSGMTLTNNVSLGSDSSVQIGCDGTEAPSGTTCTGGEEESLSISFIIPRAGNYEVCADFSSTVGKAASGAAYVNYALVETATNAQTILQQGKQVTQGQFTNSGTQSNTDNLDFCSTFNFDSVGRKMIRVFYLQDATSGTTLRLGESDAGFTVRPLDVQYPAPVINNSVTSNGNGPFRIESAYIDNGASGACNASPCTVNNETGDWISSVTRSGTGIYAVNFQSGIFSSAPSCTVTPQENRVAANDIATTSSMAVYCGDSGWTDSDCRFAIICMGPR